jgi:hypothetical protein
MARVSGERRSKDDGGSAEEPQKDYRTGEGNLRQCDEDVSYHGITIILTTTPKAHDGPLDERVLFLREEEMQQ